jgi:hypothetical protein
MPARHSINKDRVRGAGWHRRRRGHRGLWHSWDMATIRDKGGRLETLQIDLLYVHLDASFIFNHLETMNGGPTYPMQTRGAKKRVYNSSGLNHLRRYGPICDESLPYP